MTFRIEKDSMGEIKVPLTALWGAQTQRSLENFKIGHEKMPIELIHGIALVKKAAAIANVKTGKLSPEKGQGIQQAVDLILEAKVDDAFPLVVWQTGSGTQTNMNVNEVIAHLANQNSDLAIHPNDDVNMSQSSNDVFPTAIHVTAVELIEKSLLPVLSNLSTAFKKLEADNQGILKIGRTHLQDATPISFSQEISGWRTMIEQNQKMIESSLVYLKQLTIGGTAVGTGLNATAEYTKETVAALNRLTGTDYTENENKFHGLSSKDAVVFVHGALKALAANSMKIANDIRWMASGPRSGLGEITIPANEPGSSIMPGKVNPTQCEALTMIAVQVMGNDTAVGVAASQGNFELNVYMPVLAYNLIQSVTLLSDGLDSFQRHCVEGIVADQEKMQEFLTRSLMLVTALNQHIGYDNGAKIAKQAFATGKTLKETAIELALVSAEDYDRWVKPENMIGQ